MIWILWGAGVLFYAGSLVMLIRLGWIYKKLLCRSENMSAVQDRTLKQLKLKYENAYRYNNGVWDTEAFVKKFLNLSRFGGVTLSVMKRLTKALAALAGLMLSLAAMVSLPMQTTYGQGRINALSVTCLMAAQGYFFYELISAWAGGFVKEELLSAVLQDYLANFYKGRLDKEHREERKDELKELQPWGRGSGMPETLTSVIREDWPDKNRAMGCKNLSMAGGDAGGGEKKERGLVNSEKFREEMKEEIQLNERDLEELIREFFPC